MTIEWSDILVGSAGGFLMEISRLLIAYGVSTGLAGPAQALMSMHALWQAMYGAIFAGQTLTTFQVIGVACCFVAASMMSLFDTLMSKF